MTQGVRDAMADADTLRRVYRTHYKLPKRGEGVFLPDRDMPTVIGWQPIAGVYAVARAVAHAAFLACPGLRG